MAAARQAANPKDVFLGTSGWRKFVEVGLRLVLTANPALPQYRAINHHVLSAARFHVFVAVQT